MMSEMTLLRWVIVVTFAPTYYEHIVFRICSWTSLRKIKKETEKKKKKRGRFFLRMAKTLSIYTCNAIMN